MTLVIGCERMGIIHLTLAKSKYCAMNGEGVGRLRGQQAASVRLRPASLFSKPLMLSWVIPPRDTKDLGKKNPLLLGSVTGQNRGTFADYVRNGRIINYCMCVCVCARVRVCVCVRVCACARVYRLSNNGASDCLLL